MKQDTQKMVIMGTIVAPHGVRGLFKVKLFCERAEDLTAYGRFVWKMAIKSRCI